MMVWRRYTDVLANVLPKWKKLWIRKWDLDAGAWVGPAELAELTGHWLELEAVKLADGRRIALEMKFDYSTDKKEEIKMKIKVVSKSSETVIEPGTLVELIDKPRQNGFEVPERPVLMVTDWPSQGNEFSGMVLVPSADPFRPGEQSKEWTKSLYRIFRGTITLEQ